MAYMRNKPTRRRKAPRKTAARRKGYTGKKTPRYTLGSSLTNGPLGAQLAVYKNPLSTATTCPKIPDQKAGMSAGMRLQQVSDLVFRQETIHILLFPGANNGAIIRGVVDDNGAKGNMPFIKHVQIDASGAELNIPSKEQKWRVVSQALKLTLVNNSDENDGWFECIRCACNAGEFRFTGPGTNNAIIGSALANGIPGIDTDESIVENNTYMSGKLRDIHRYIFQLHPQINNHDFKHVADIEDLGNDDVNSNEVLEKMVDDSFDCIYLRIHGRQGNGNPNAVPPVPATVNPTRLMAHLVSNHEVVYDEKEPMARFHTETNRAAPGVVDKVRDSIRRNNKAAKVLYAGL